MFRQRAVVFIFCLFLCGCARLFGWDIHSPGILSADYQQKIVPIKQRVALFVNPASLSYQSTHRGGKWADPQIYHIGEAFGPMVVEAFQSGFDEFVFMEIEPRKDILKKYDIPYVVVTRISDFENRVTLKGQTVSVLTETAVLDSDLNLLRGFETTGLSDAKKVFAKKGGPEVNLNAAIENNVTAVVQEVQDVINSKLPA